MRYLLDTNAVIGILDGATALNRRLRREKAREIALSSIAVHELYYGAFKSQRRAPNLEVVDSIGFEVLAFDRNDARVAGEIRAALAIAGTPIGPYDVLIAGQAKARDLVLVTSNVREFRRVAGLEIANWSEPYN
ncbi:MAG TPA: type II toxin-antitoxin system VapC family toxin [Beijerinckiaceae bacterium]|jgi:tRNA(fMet)-specific endonuclease VapC|nr:pilus assembly protein [Microvirga sp.]HZB38178.1 type II toxin-antitoxin system VapC family toxin [Beijerinckiaceae bacterium]